MNILLRIAYLALVYGFLSLVTNAAEDASQAPYFHVLSGDDHAGETLPLKSSRADVRIDGTIARVTLEQTYGNLGTRPIEATYVFPASTRAAVHGMTLTAGERVVTASIHEKTAAKAGYEKAKAERKTAALLEEHRPNVFQMSVANLLPGEDIRVRLEWSELVTATDGVYEFVFPTVTGPRYTGGSDRGETWTANPHLPAGTPETASFQLAAALRTALPLVEVRCPSHPVKIDFQDKSTASVEITARSGEAIANRDFILRWKLAKDQVDAGLLLHRGEKESHFLLQMEPPARIAAEQLPPRDYVFVLDVSGSMEGFPLNVAKNLLGDLARGLREDDTFNIVTFAGGSDVFSETPVPSTPRNIQAAREFIGKRQAGGGTELTPALQRALALPGGENRSRSLVIVTDGFISTEEAACRIIRKRTGEANVFTFGIGSSVNRHLIEGMARAGQGEPFVVTSATEATQTAERFLKLVSAPVLAKIRVEAEGVAIEDLEPATHPDLFANRPLTLTGRFQGEPRGAIVIRGIAGNGASFEKRFDLADAARAGADHPALPILWARERVRALTETPDPGEKEVREITRLGLAWSLLTPHTSFLAVDETPRATEAIAKTVKQPLPMPQGVGNAAIGGGKALAANASVPEPGSIGLIALLVTLLALQRRK